MLGSPAASCLLPGPGRREPQLRPCSEQRPFSGTKVIADNTGVWHACGLLGSMCFTVVPPAGGRADTLCVLNDGVGWFPEESWGNLPRYVKPLRTLREASVPPATFRSDLRGG